MTESLSARRAWIEIAYIQSLTADKSVALRKESVDRNRLVAGSLIIFGGVALRKESVDRNRNSIRRCLMSVVVALRKESVDRN